VAAVVVQRQPDVRQEGVTAVWARLRWARLPVVEVGPDQGLDAGEVGCRRVGVSCVEEIEKLDVRLATWGKALARWCTVDAERPHDGTDHVEARPSGLAQFRRAEATRAAGARKRDCQSQRRRRD